MPRVSVITATYNRSEVLRWAIESVRAQTFEDWEQIVIGDGCTDDTAAVITSFGDPRIRFVNRPVNYGEQSVPNNDGFGHATGDLVAYLNHDDLWFPDHLETLVSYLERTGADLVYALPVSVDRHGTAFCGVTNAEHCYGRPGCYVTRDDSQHREFRKRMQTAGHREYLATKMAMDTARELARVSALRTSFGVGRLLDRIMVLLHLHPDAVRNRLAGRRRGWWIDRLRELRGLSPMREPGREP